MNVVLGGGLAGLTAGYALEDAIVIEKAPEVGGLARTLSFGPCRFDIGGHRFYTDLPEVQALMDALLGPELLRVKRKSTIIFQGKRVPYPLTGAGCLRAMGPVGATLALADYLYQRLKTVFRSIPVDNLQDWVVAHFGETLYKAFFKDYSEKVWGISAHEISSDWISKRIQNLDLKQLLKSIIVGSDKRTLLDSFVYPETGIGRISEALRDSIQTKGGKVLCSCKIVSINHDSRQIHSVTFLHGDTLIEVPCSYLISTIPLTSLLRYLDGPELKLRYRDLLLVVIVFPRSRLTEDTWIYIPHREIPFGRVHEPKNWSPKMAPEDMSHLVVEFFCDHRDSIWNSRDEQLIRQSLGHLKALALVDTTEYIDAEVVRIPNAYPLFDVSYKRQLTRAVQYLSRFKNLILAGRTGAFSYLNMDEAMASGLQAAKKLKEAAAVEVCTSNTTMAA